MHADTGSPDPGEGEQHVSAGVIDFEVRESRGKLVAGPATESTVARAAGELAMSLCISSVRAGLRFGRTFYRSAATSSLGRAVADAAAGAVDTAGKQLGRDWTWVERRAQTRIGDVISIVVPVVVQALDPEELLEYIDVDAILASVDVNALLEQVDVDALLERVDVNALLERIDIDGLMQRADVEALVARVDADGLLAGVDLDAVLERVDVARLAKRARVGELVAESTSDVASSALDLGRRQAVGVDTVVARTVNRLLGRDPDSMPLGPDSLIEPPGDQTEHE